MASIKIVISICVAILAVTYAKNSLPSSKECNNENSEPRLIELGMVDGKNITADKSYRGWSDAKRYCESNGRQLIEITSQAQQDFLKNAFSTEFSGWFWTAARDSSNPSRFVWDSNEAQVGNYSQGWGLYSGITACVAYRASVSEASNGMWESYPCGSSNYVLCQSS